MLQGHGLPGVRLMAWDCQWCGGRKGGCMLCNALPPKDPPIPVEEDYPRSAWDVKAHDYGPRGSEKPRHRPRSR
jgi:hypothetical protein